MLEYNLYELKAAFWEDAFGDGYSETDMIKTMSDIYWSVFSKADDYHDAYNKIMSETEDGRLLSHDARICINFIHDNFI